MNPTNRREFIDTFGLTPEEYERRESEFYEPIRADIERRVKVAHNSGAHHVKVHQPTLCNECSELETALLIDAGVIDGE